MKDKVVGGMQNFSKAMIGPVLFLPVVGMLIALTAIATNTAIRPDHPAGLPCDGYGRVPGNDHRRTHCLGT